MVFHVLTLFPDMIRNAASYSIFGKAVSRGNVSLDVVNIRDYTADAHGKVDDEPYGGGAGMLMQAQPVYDAYCAVRSRIPAEDQTLVYYLSPKASPMTQSDVRRMAKADHLVFLCGHYEGIDERVLEEIEAQPLSIGDYILTGGELPALVAMDAVSRFLDGVLHNAASAETETFAGHLLEYPQYTRPPRWKGREVPPVLLTGHAENIRSWRKEESVRLTKQYRPDLYERFLKEEALRTLFWRDRKNSAILYNALESCEPKLLTLPGTDAVLEDPDTGRIWCRTKKEITREEMQQLMEQLFEDVHASKADRILLTLHPDWAEAFLKADPRISYRICTMAVYTPRQQPSRSKWARAVSASEAAVPAEILQMMENAEPQIRSGRIPAALFDSTKITDHAFLAGFDIYLSEYQVFACFF